MTTVTANTRLARRMRTDFDRRASAGGYWETPAILPWRAWIGRLWDEAVYSGTEPRVLISGAQELILWEQAIRATGVDLLNVAGTARTAAQAWNLMHSWRLPRPAAVFAEIPDTAGFFAWANAFQAMIAKRGFVTEAEAPEILLAQGFEPPEAYAGFDELTPVQRDLFAGAAQILNREVLPGQRRRTSAPDSEQELWMAARWAREQLERNPAAQVGVVLPDLAARRVATNRIFEEVLGTARAFHMSVARPLTEVPVVADALLALKYFAGMPLAEAGRMWRSPYLAHTTQEGARRDLELRRRGVATVRSGEDRGWTETPMRPSQWSKAFSRAAAAAGWPGTRGLSSEEFQAVEAWKRLLATFSTLDAVLGELEFGAAISRLEKLAADTGFGPEDEDEPVQIMTDAEAAGSWFDALWIGGLEDTAWPATVRPNPFLPLQLQRAAGIPNSTVEREYARVKRATARLLASGHEVVCSYRRTNGDEELRPSPLIAGLEEFPSLEELVRTPPAVLEVVAVDPAPPLAGDRFVKGGMGVIADQSACPFRAFAKHRLGARGLDEVEPGLTDQERGNVTHGALERIWSVLKSQRALLDTSPEELAELVESSIRQALERKLGEGSKGLKRIQSLEVKRLSRILIKWLEQEKARPEFETSGLEEVSGCEVGGLSIEVRADRVDRYADGTYAILDYKTGGDHSKSEWATERPKEPQLPLYAILMTEPVSTVAFAEISAKKSALEGISQVGDLELKPPKGVGMPEQIEEWRGVLHALGAAFVAGEAAVDPLNDACKYCDLKGLCRVATHE
jgi:RecB family exonuclease